MGLNQCLDCFQFEDDSAGNNEVCNILTNEFPTIADRKGNLLGNLYS